MYVYMYMYNVIPTLMLNHNLAVNSTPLCMKWTGTCIYFNFKGDITVNIDTDRSNFSFQDTDCRVVPGH